MARPRQKRSSWPQFRPGVISWLLSVYCRSKSNSGFILPTATLLIVVAFLIMMSLLARTANRVAQVAGQRERIAVEGPSSESIDRARAKLEYLLTQGWSELPRDPSEQDFEDFLGNRLREGGEIRPRKSDDPYTLPDEIRCGAQNGDCLNAGAAFTPDGIAPTWAYRVDLNGNGTVNDPADGIAVYSIVGRVFRGNKSAVPFEGKEHLKKRSDRAAHFVVNNAPVKAEAANAFCEGATGGAQGEVSDKGRFLTRSSAEEVKNFQIYALTIPNRPDNANLTSHAVVFQQDRVLTGANKWGAYFRYDLEIFPGPQFNWNGAMHTEGTLFVTAGRGFTSYLISAPNSCYYLPPLNSQISARGLFMTGSNRDNENNPGNSQVHLQPAGRIAPTQFIQLATRGGFPNPTGPGTFNSQDAVRDNPEVRPVDVSMDPLYLLTNNLPVPRRTEGGRRDYSIYKDENWGGALASRIQISKCEAPPYVDDTYRADNRLGPKPSYERDSCEMGAQTWRGNAGDLITNKPEWTTNEPPPNDPDGYGLDGYWERRALGQGMKVIVGQRLELGNVGVWGGWRTFGDRNNWTNDTWRQWAGIGGAAVPGTAERRIYQPTTTPYFSGTVPPYSQEIFGLLFRPRPTIAGTIPAPGAADPLYPPAVLATEFGGETPYDFRNSGVPGPTFNTSRLIEQLNRRTQRDNLAAVQAAAVYHHKAPDRTLPLLCLSSTIHPGTEASYLNSITFGDPVSPASPTKINEVTRYPSSNANYVRPPQTQRLFPEADFFTGRGTANMEYGDGGNPDAPPFEVADFERGTSLRKVLTNLAQFAGDPNGAFPPLQAPPGSRQVYPDPVLTMWGDFSNLRRTIATLERGTSYAELSPADQANLHTAGCTMSLLATNVHHYLAFPFYLSQGGERPHNNDSTGLLPPPNTDQGSPLQIDLQRLGNVLRQLQDGNPATLGEIGFNIPGFPDLSFVPLNNSNGPCTNINTINPNCYNIPAEYYIAALARIRDSRPFNLAPNSEYQQWNRLVYLARMVNTRLQIVRDRTYGFREYVPGQWIGVETVPTNDQGNGTDPATGLLLPNNQRLAYTFLTESATGPYRRRVTIDLPCDLSLADIRYFGYQKFDPERGGTALNPNNPQDQILEREMVALARLCPTQPKYPSLYYLFPGDLNSDGRVEGSDSHGHDGTSGINRRNSPDPSPYNQPSGSAQNNRETFSEPYVLSSYIAETANNAATYEPVSLTDLNALRLEPRRPDAGQWKLPVVNLFNNRPVGATELYQRETDLLISVFQPNNAHTNLSAYRTGLAEKALYDGRQLQMARVMDFDIDLLRQVNLSPFGDDAWLAVGQVATATTPAIAGGIIYAFREDARREDALLRPANSDWNTYEAAWEANYADGPPVNLQMNPDPRNPSDPPRTQKKISGKPVDYYSDPDRRVHGFRLMNGNDVSRLQSQGQPLPPAQNIFGMTFVSDNPVYIMTQLARGVSGFNLHMKPGGNEVVQEFRTELRFPYTFDDFYGRDTRDSAFANPQTDTWRPVEIIADAITLITHNFCDGYQENGIRNVRNTTAGLNIPGKDANGDCHGSPDGGPSARNTPAIDNPGVAGFNRPDALPRNRWARENPYDEASPIIIGSDGTHRTQTNGLQAIVPLGNYQGIGSRAAVPGRGTDYQVNAVIVSGLVPSRRNQSYGGLHNFPRFLETGNNLTILGSLIQLNFSNYATAPFDFDSFERGQSPDRTELIPYYGPPQRYWGYDPALQYAPAGPVARRFVQMEGSRNEYFLELTADDPYTCQLKRFIVPGVTCRP